MSTCDKFIIYTAEDFYNKGDVVMVGASNFIVIKTYRNSIFKKFLKFIGINIKVNNQDRCLIKVKKLHAKV